MSLFLYLFWLVRFSREVASSLLTEVQSWPAFWEPSWGNLFCIYNSKKNTSRTLIIWNSKYFPWIKTYRVIEWALLWFLHFAPRLSGVKHSAVLMVSVGQEFGHDVEGMARLCSMMCRVSARRTQHFGVTWWVGAGTIFPHLLIDVGCGFGPHLGMWSESACGLFM